MHTLLPPSIPSPFIWIYLRFSFGKKPSPYPMYLFRVRSIRSLEARPNKGPHPADDWVWEVLIAEPSQSKQRSQETHLLSPSGLKSRRRAWRLRVQECSNIPRWAEPNQEAKRAQVLRTSHFSPWVPGARLIMAFPLHISVYSLFSPSQMGLAFI